VKIVSINGLNLPPEAQTTIRQQKQEHKVETCLTPEQAEKLDLARISILSLVEQYLAVIEGAARVRLELAADWLVMAAWLAWLKSRLLLPPDSAEAEAAGDAAEQLAARLRALQQMRAAAHWLAAQPTLGQDVFARGAPENFLAADRSRLAADLAGLLRAYAAARIRAAAQTQYRPAAPALWSVQQALARLESLVGGLPDWSRLERFLPERLRTPLERRGAMASTLLAGLELARGGALRLRQDEPFGPILLRRGGEDG
jgi:segregation and condensation protein A